jgi:hypothetical protein
MEVAVASQSELQIKLVFEVMVALSKGGSVNVTDVSAVQPFASVAVTVYDPAHRPFAGI